MRNSISNFLKKSISAIYGIFGLVILFLCLFCSDIRYARAVNLPFFLPEILLLLFGIAVFVLLFEVGRKMEKITSKRWQFCLRLIFIALFLLQIVAVDKYYFYTDWDVYNINVLSDYVVDGMLITPEQNYYISMYPNNQFIIILFVLIKYPFYRIGLYELGYYMVLVVQCLLNSLTGYLTTRIIGKIFNNQRISFIIMCLYIFLIGISPWVSIPYTDSIGLIFPVLLIYVYISRDSFKKAWIFWGVIAAITIIGYNIKPQICFVAIAIIILEIISVISDGFNKKQILSVVSFVVCLSIGVLVINGLKSMLPVTINKGDSFSATHYLMMGLNEEDMGIWSSKDVAFSNSFTDYSERQQANLDVAKSRLENMGISGLLKLWARKTLCNFNDGTFGWSGEGYFFFILRDTESSMLTDFYRNVYYTPDNMLVENSGKFYAVWVNFEQLIWLSSLLVGFFSCFEYKDKNKNIITVTLIGLILFQTIFEARSRYLYIYAPYFLMLTAFTIRVVITKLDALKKEKTDYFSTRNI